MKIINQTEKIYIYDEFEIQYRPKDITVFRRCKNARVPYWEYLDDFEAAWLSVDVGEREEELENLYQEWLAIKN